MQPFRRCNALKRRLFLALLFLLLWLPALSSASDDSSLLLIPGSYEAGVDFAAGSWTILPEENEVIIVTLCQYGREKSTVVTGFGYYFQSPDIVPALDMTLSAGCQITIAGGAAQLTLCDDVMVWVSENGKRYHRLSDCSHMRSPQQIPEEEAIASGRKPCSNCWD